MACKDLKTNDKWVQTATHDDEMMTKPIHHMGT